MTPSPVVALKTGCLQVVTKGVDLDSAFDDLPNSGRTSRRWKAQTGCGSLSKFTARQFGVGASTL